MTFSTIDLTERALVLYTRKPGAQQPAADLPSSTVAGECNPALQSNPL